MTQFLRDQASDSEEVVTPLMLDGTYLSRNFATLGPLTRQPPCDSLHYLWRAAAGERDDTSVDHEESKKEDSWRSRTCYPSRATNQGLTDGELQLSVLVCWSG